MSPPEYLRASDAEREQTADVLRTHCVQGRITPAELAERLEEAYSARTVAELATVTHDLPPAPPLPRPVHSTARERVIQAIGTVALVNAACVVVWLATGGTDGVFWPKWVLLVSAIRLAFLAWAELGPGARDETRLGRGGSRRALPPDDRR